MIDALIGQAYSLFMVAVETWGSLYFFDTFLTEKNKPTTEIPVCHMVCVYGDWGAVRKIDWMVENDSHSFGICAFVLAFLSDSLLAEFFLCYAKLLSAACHRLFDCFDIRLADV